MECKNCNNTLCPYRTSDAEKDCFYERHPDYPMPREWNNNNTDWQALRNQAAIAAMQGLIMSNTPDVLDKGTPKASREYLAKTSVQIADALIKELREEK